jgi:hypothetical protein
MSSLAFRNIFRHFPSALTGRANLLTLLFSLLFSLGAFSPRAWAADAEVIGPELKFQDGQIHVTASLSLQEKSLQELRNGVTKELRFHIDLFKVWKMWPDEYVGGRFFIRTLKSDPVRWNIRQHPMMGTPLFRRSSNHLNQCFSGRCPSVT